MKRKAEGSPSWRDLAVLVTDGVGIHSRQAAWCRKRLQNDLHATLIPFPGPNDAIATWPNRASSRILILSQCEGGAAEEPKFVRSIYATLEDRFDDVPPFNELTFVKKSILDPGQSGNIQALIAANSLLSESPAAEDSGEEGSGGKERVAKGIDFSVYASDGAKNMACKRRTPLVTKNPELVGMTSEILEFIRADASKQQTATATPYERSLSVLRCWPVKLELCGEECERREDGGHVDSCMYQLKGAHLLGPSTLRNVKEALQNLQRTGEVTCNKLERFRENKKLCAVRELMKVPYVGLGTATKWVGLYEGTHKLDDIADLKVLDERYGIVGMNDNIHVCLEHIDDILQKMPRELCKQVVESYLEPVFDQLNLRYQIVGGYRRGKPSGHDIDILLTSKDPPDLGLGPFPKVVPIGSVSDPYNSHEVLEVLLNAVDKCPHIDLVSRLRAGAGQYGSGGEALGVGLLLLRFPELENTVRRVDLVVTSPKQWPFALLGWSGSKMFEKSIRGYVDSYVNNDNKGSNYKWSLSQTRLTLRADMHHVLEVLCQTEEDIFKFIELEYLPPEYRCA